MAGAPSTWFVAIVRATTSRCFESPLHQHTSPVPCLSWGPALSGGSQGMEISRSPRHGRGARTGQGLVSPRPLPPPTSRNWALTLNSGAATPWLWAARLRSSMPLKRWVMALGMMPCSSSEMLMSKPVPMVYVFPAPVCAETERGELAGPSHAQLCPMHPTFSPCYFRLPQHPR